MFRKLCMNVFLITTSTGVALLTLGCAAFLYGARSSHFVPTLLGVALACSALLLLNIRELERQQGNPAERLQLGMLGAHVVILALVFKRAWLPVTFWCSLVLVSLVVAARFILFVTELFCVEEVNENEQDA